MVRLRRFGCTRCRRVWRQDISTLAEPRARLTRSAVEWGLRALALECMSVSRVAAALGVSWYTANKAILASAQATLLDDPRRFVGVEVLGVDDSPARFALVREGPLCVAPHQTGRPVRHRHDRLDLRARPQWSAPPGSGSWPSALPYRRQYR